ncbi:MAG: hypothetical protein JWP74_450 [Marmoricola sp.]|nr:hypothetical protein [Marmoricola sp.]
MTDREPDHRQGPGQQQILAVVLKFVGIALGIFLVIGLATWFVVKSLDLGTTDSSSSVPVQPINTPSSPLPSTAIPQPDDSDSPLPDDSTEPVEPTQTPGSTAMFLSASPVVVSSMDRINLTGTWPGHDAISLAVQRFEGGSWVDFGVQTQLEVGTFATYVQTTHSGPNKFRVYDPSTGTASNAVTVTVGK